MIKLFLLATTLSLISLAPAFCMEPEPELQGKIYLDQAQKMILDGDREYNEECKINNAYLQQKPTLIYLKKAIVPLKKASALGNTDAKYQLGVVYNRLRQEHPKYERHAFKMVKKASDEGSKDAAEFLYIWWGIEQPEI